jgi:hypothetical protein
LNFIVRGSIIQTFFEGTKSYFSLKISTLPPIFLPFGLCRPRRTPPHPNRPPPPQLRPLMPSIDDSQHGIAELLRKICLK